MEWKRGAMIGRGSFSTVSLAIVDETPSRFPRLAAAKSAPLSSSSLLQKEESVLKNLQDGHHPNIISFFGHDVTAESGGDRFYNLFLEFLPDGTLFDLLRRSVTNSLPESSVKDYIRSVLKGLQYIHSKGYVHCDIKLQNLLIAGDGTVKIADFGLAKRAGEIKEEKSEFLIRGTPLYMSPESVARKEYEAPMDVWSVGCAVVEMITGRPAWWQSVERNNNNDMWGLLLKIGFGEEVPEIPSEISEEGKDFLRKCFVRDPAKRWTAEMLLNHPFIANETVVELGSSDQCNVIGELRLLQSPTGVFNFFESPSTSCSSICSSVGWSPEDCAAAAPRDRIGSLATGKQQPDWWSDDGWISVREGDQCGGSNDPADRIRILATGGKPDWWCCSWAKEGWISVREGCCEVSDRGASCSGFDADDRRKEEGC